MAHTELSAILTNPDHATTCSMIGRDAELMRVSSQQFLPTLIMLQRAA